MGFCFIRDIVFFGIFFPNKLTWSHPLTHKRPRPFLKFHTASTLSIRIRWVFFYRASTILFSTFFFAFNQVPAFRQKYNLSHQNWKSQVTSKAMFDEVTFSRVTDIIYQLYVRYFESSQESDKAYWYFSKRIYNQSDSFFKMRAHPYFGQCVTSMVTKEMATYGFYYSRFIS